LPGIAFNGKLKSDLIPQLSAKFSGDANFFNFKDYETKAQFEIYYPATGPEINLGKFFQAAEGFALKGRFLETGSFVIRKDRLSAVVKSSLSDGKLHHPKNKIVIEGIQLDLMFPEIPKMQSVAHCNLHKKPTRANGSRMRAANGFKRNKLAMDPHRRTRTFGRATCSAKNTPSRCAE
jgi:hypothetical protein